MSKDAQSSPASRAALPCNAAKQSGPREVIRGLLREYNRVLKPRGVLVLVTTRTLEELGGMLLTDAWCSVDVACIRIALQAAKVDPADEMRYEQSSDTEDDDSDEEEPSVPRGAVGTRVPVDKTTFVATAPSSVDIAEHYVEGYQDFYIYRCLKHG